MIILAHGLHLINSSCMFGAMAGAEKGSHMDVITPMAEATMSYSLRT